MLDGVTGPVLLAAQTEVAVVREAADHADLAPGIVVAGIRPDLRAEFDRGAHGSLGLRVDVGRRGRAREIALHDVGDHVDDAGGDLMARQRHEAFGIDDGRGGAQAFGADTGLRAVVRDHAPHGLLGTRGGDRQHGEHGQGLFGNGVAVEEVPAVALVLEAKGNALGGVDHGAAAHGDDKTHALIAHPVDRLAHEAQAGVGMDAALFNHRHACGLKALPHRGEKAGADDGAAAVDHKALVGAGNGFSQTTGFIFGAASEDEADRIVVGKVQHACEAGLRPLLFMPGGTAAGGLVFFFRKK